MRAEVRLTAYKQRTVPLVHGDVRTVSADRLTDAKTGAPYYLVQIKLDEAELARLGEVKLVPGMAAEVAIPTSARTALEYLVRPITDSLNRSFRQR
jgi:multidrug efflux pump subunit AcrA (membrane-fusion protein)